MAAFAQSAEPNFFLESFDIESMRMLLVLIPSIPADEAVVLGIKLALAHGVGEVELAQVVNEYIFRNVLYSCDVPTHVLGQTGVVHLACSMCHHLFSPSPIFGPHCPVMVALDVESEEAATLDHPIISLLVLFESFQVCDIPSNITQTDCTDQIHEIGQADHQPGRVSH